MLLDSPLQTEPEPAQTLHVRFPARCGLRGRQAAMLVRLAQSFNARLELTSGGMETDARNIMDLLALDPERSPVLTVTAAGPEAEPMLAAIEELFDRWARAAREPAVDMMLTGRFPAGLNPTG